MAQRNCLQCGKSFAFKRDDHFFCSGKCVAQYYRDNPNPRNIHCDLPHNKPHTCEWCGVPYHVNDYAERGGERKPKYCSPKCKQAAYRARGQATQEQAERRYTGSRHQERREEPRREQRQEQRQEQRRRPASTTRMDGTRAWKVLEIEPTTSMSDIRKAWLKMLKRYHPDVCSDADATQKTQEINAAYEYLKTHVAR